MDSHEYWIFSFCVGDILQEYAVQIMSGQLTHEDVLFWREKSAQSKFAKLLPQELESLLPVVAQPHQIEGFCIGRLW